jgi:transcriptional regulator with XRE-family HTH domain
MAKDLRSDFSKTIRDRRRKLELTQEEVARKTGTSAGFIALIETGKRIPLDKVLGKLALVLRLDVRDLFLLAKPKVAELIKPAVTQPATWESFLNDKPLHQKHRITPEEMQFLARVAELGKIKDHRDFIFILIAVRYVIVDRYPRTERPL